MKPLGGACWLLWHTWNGPVSSEGLGNARAGGGPTSCCSLTEEAPNWGQNETMRGLDLACTGLLSKDRAHGPPGSLERAGATPGQDVWLLGETVGRRGSGLSLHCEGQTPQAQVSVGKDMPPESCLLCGDATFYQGSQPTTPSLEDHSGRLGGHPGLLCK